MTNQKKEAIARMKQLKMLKEAIQTFEDNDKVIQSQVVPGIGGGIMYNVSEKIMPHIKEFEERHEALVYHVILSNTSIGKVWVFLYVSKNEEEWGQDRNDIKEGRAMAHACEETHYEDDIGIIGIKPENGGVRRTA